MFILDTDIVIWILRRHQKIIRFVEKLSIEDFSAVSTMTVAEVYQNILDEEMENMELFLAKQEVMPVTLEVGKIGGIYWQKHHRKFAKLSLVDCLIAATAKFNDSQLVTLNTRHFSMMDISLLNPLI